MPEIEFSVMVHTPQTEAVLRSLLDEFEAQSGVRVHLHSNPWSSVRGELNKIALYHHGPDVSEIGSTWVSDLVAMNAIRPFSNAETQQIGRSEEFLPESWKSGQMVGDPTQWAIPWLAETYLIHYRRDLLQQAGIDEARAFQSHQTLAETVEALFDRGIEIPFELSLKQDHFGLLHSLASWVWTAGGEFCTQDGRQVLFDQPAAVEAMRAYFHLVKRLSPRARRKIRDRKAMLYEQGGSALTFGTLMFYDTWRNGSPTARENTAVSVLPGQHFVGGSNLVLWKHTRNEQPALELVRFLTSPEVQEHCTLPLNTLSPRLSALESPTIREHPVYRVMAESIRTGRTYDSVPLWGLIEDRLMGTLVQIGLGTVAEDAMDLDAVIGKSMESLARKLNVTLSQ